MPSARLRLFVISDVHYACDAEAARRHTCLDPIQPPWRRWLVHQYRRHVWLRDPFGHNARLDRFIAAADAADVVVANGDFSCDTAYVGVMDDAAFESASLCLGKLRARFGGRFHATMGDHEIGKKMLAADVGGLRLASYRRSEHDLGLAPFWQARFGRCVLVGIVSTLVALPVYEAEALPEELPAWRELREAHLETIRRAFAAFDPADRVLLFCHDPTALPFLGREPAVRARLPQLERTFIGHLHSPSLLKPGEWLSGLPPVECLGHTVRRLSLALREARHWRPFRPLLCPSPHGIELFKDGGYYTVEIDPDARHPARFVFHPLGWG
jgi:hypothetical protein